MKKPAQLKPLYVAISFVPGTWPLDEPTCLECVRILFAVDVAYKVTSIDLQANAIE